MKDQNEEQPDKEAENLDFTSMMNILSARMEEFERVHGDPDLLVSGLLAAPIEVRVLDVRAGGSRSSNRPGSAQPGDYVAVRLAGDADKRAYLGVYIGDMTTPQPMIQHSPKSGTLFVLGHTNPAIWVPDLKRVVWGCESWWSQIRSELDLRQITDADIESTWYVQALRALSPDADKNEAP